jgi:hypothetical protein
MAYNIHKHSHIFAAWAAARAASSSKVCRFKVESGRTLLESTGLNDSALQTPQELPVPEELDSQHQTWRETMVAKAKDHGLATFTHGIAAKLINVYLKSRFVCGGFSDHAKVRCLHPPIDSVLLKNLARNNVGGRTSIWRNAQKKGWSNFDSKDYQGVIDSLRQAFTGHPLWQTEQYWDGNR